MSSLFFSMSLPLPPCLLLFFSVSLSLLSTLSFSCSLSEPCLALNQVFKTSLKCIWILACEIQYQQEKLSMSVWPEPNIWSLPVSEQSLHFAPSLVVSSQWPIFSETHVRSVQPQSCILYQNAWVWVPVSCPILSSC